jgi:hypothetical protein
VNVVYGTPGVTTFYANVTILYQQTEDCSSPNPALFYGTVCIKFMPGFFCFFVFFVFCLLVIKLI